MKNSRYHAAQLRWPWTVGRRRIRFHDPVRRWLVVDDDRSMRLVLRRLLSVLRVECDVAADGCEAWQMLLQHGYEGVVTDIDMPRCSGLSLLDRVRKSSVACIASLPVLILSSRDCLGPIVTPEHDRRTFFLPKPVDIRSLALIVQQSRAATTPGRCQF